MREGCPFEYAPCCPCAKCSVAKRYNPSVEHSWTVICSLLIRRADCNQRMLRGESGTDEPSALDLSVRVRLSSPSPEPCFHDQRPDI